MTTHRARPPVHWRAKQAADLVALLTAGAAPVTPVESAHWNAYMAQAVYALNMAAALMPRAPERPAVAPPTPPSELLVAPYVGLDGKIHETWKESAKGESRYRALHEAFRRNLARSTQTIGGFNVGPRVMTFTYPAGPKAPAIEGVSS